MTCPQLGPANTAATQRKRRVDVDLSNSHLLDRSKPATNCLPRSSVFQLRTCVAFRFSSGGLAPSSLPYDVLKRHWSIIQEAHRNIRICQSAFVRLRKKHNLSCFAGKNIRNYVSYHRGRGGDAMAFSKGKTLQQITTGYHIDRWRHQWYYWSKSKSHSSRQGVNTSTTRRLDGQWNIDDLWDMCSSLAGTASTPSGSCWCCVASGRVCAERRSCVRSTSGPDAGGRRHSSPCSRGSPSCSVRTASGRTWRSSSGSPRSADRWRWTSPTGSSPAVRLQQGRQWGGHCFNKRGVTV